jgi:hypothetical protein
VFSSIIKEPVKSCVFSSVSALREKYPFELLVEEKREF